MRKLLIIILFFSCVGNSDTQGIKPLNIIILIGDGMGLPQITGGTYANNNESELENFKNIGLIKTFAKDDLITDSAASGTAFACGVKTYNGTIGIDYKGKEHSSILEICQKIGYSTGIIVTSEITHATPASYYAKVQSRDNHEEIANQLSSKNINFFVGGGKKYFVDRKDKRNLLNEMRDYDFVSNIKEYDKSKSSKIGFLTYDDAPPSLPEGRIPSLDKLTKLTIEKLKNESKPFFLVIEGSQIDWACHDHDIDYFLEEFKEFDKTIKTVMDFAKKDKNTLVVVTADHETGGFHILGGRILKENSYIKGDFLTTGHSGDMVPIFSYGPYSENFSGIYDNTEIFKKLNEIVKK